MSYSSMRTARAVDPGKWRLDVAPSFVGAPRTAVAAKADVGIRVGVVDRVDVGLRLQGIGGEGSLTVQPVRSNSVDVAVAPSVGYTITANFDDEETKIAFAKLPVLVGFDFGDASEHQVVLGPTLVGLASDASGNLGSDGLGTGTFTTLLGGGSLGVSFAITSRFRLLPEIDLFTPLAGKGLPVGSAATPQMIESPNVAFGRPFLVQVAVGLSFGNDGRGE